MLRALKVPSSLALECTLKKIPASLTDGTIRKPLSISAANAKRYVINDHYEFDQKVSKDCVVNVHFNGVCRPAFMCVHRFVSHIPNIRKSPATISRARHFSVSQLQLTNRLCVTKCNHWRRYQSRLDCNGVDFMHM